MSEPVAFYRGDWKGDLVFRKNNTVDVRKNKSDFTKGLIKPLYADNPNQPPLTIPKSVAKQADKSSFNEMITLGAQAFYWWFNHEQDEYIPVIYAYLAGKALGVDLVKVVEG